MNGDEDFYQEGAPHSSGESNSVDAAFINEESTASRSHRAEETPQEGRRWFQELGDEEIVTIPYDNFADHSLILGTTRPGKTRIYDLLIRNG